MSNTPDAITPNVIIKNPATRRRVGVALYLVAGFAGLASFVLAGVDLNGIDVDFWVTKVTGGVSILSALFGLTVTTPNVPR